MNKNPLGQDNSYEKNSESYNPELLFPISRLENRSKLGLASNLPFSGYDRWNAYEFSWLNEQGLPKVAQLTIDIPCESLFMVESKSLKLYLNSYSFKDFTNEDEVLSLICNDLKALLKTHVHVSLTNLKELSNKAFEYLAENNTCLDDILLNSTDIDFDTVDANVLSIEDEMITQTLSSHLFRSLCPVTSQPDWASIIISYQGKKINKESLLRYLLSFRKHQGFHEDCVERIYCDLQQACAPEHLSVYAAFTRRGGIDINPFRSNYQKAIPFGRLARQ